MSIADPITQSKITHGIKCDLKHLITFLIRVSRGSADPKRDHQEPQLSELEKKWKIMDDGKWKLAINISLF